MGKNKRGHTFGGMSMFDNDEFFTQGFGKMGSFGGFSSFGSMGNGGGNYGVSKSVSTVTKTINGKTATTKKTTIMNPDGSKEVTEETIDGGQKVKKTYSLGPTDTRTKAMQY